MFNFREKITPQAEHESGFYEKVINKIIDKWSSDIDRKGKNINGGSTADILILEENNTICVKAIRPGKTHARNIKLYNRAKAELSLLDNLSNPEFLRSIGIDFNIVPKPLYAKETVGGDFLFMEKIEGFSIKDLIKENKYDDLPKDFDVSAFLNKLEFIINTLNEKANIFHRDFHYGNIMINELGNPIIIDFGDAKEIYLSGEDPYKEDDNFGNVTQYRSDKNNLADVKEQLESYIQKNKKTIVFA